MRWPPSSSWFCGRWCSTSAPATSIGTVELERGLEALCRSLGRRHAHPLADSPLRRDPDPPPPLGATAERPRRAGPRLGGWRARPTGHLCAATCSRSGAASSSRPSAPSSSWPGGGGVGPPEPRRHRRDLRPRRELVGPRGVRGGADSGPPTPKTFPWGAVGRRRRPIYPGWRQPGKCIASIRAGFFTLCAAAQACASFTSAAPSSPPISVPRRRLAIWA